MYITTVESTFKEYPFHGVYISPTMDESKDYAKKMMEEIRDTTTNERQKKFASFLINKIENEEKISFGFGLGDVYIAVDIISKEEYDVKVEDTKNEIEKKIKKTKDKLYKMYSEYDALIHDK